MATTYVPPADGGIFARPGRLVSRSGKYWLTVRVQDDVVFRPPGGNGFLAGTSPDGRTTLDGSPVSATVIVRYRAPIVGGRADGVVVGSTVSAPDGTWNITGLNPGLTYNVEARLVGHKDVLVSNVTPVGP